ncbi:MAG: LPS assembly lipoprotein LptE [Gammaproteobacteria bacterium]
MFKYFQILLITSFMSGCGFHLAGEGTFADELSNTYVQGASSSKEMLRLLEKNLRSNQINVVESDNATAVLRIINEETEKVVLTVDNDGKAREFELLLKVKFDVRRSDNTVLLNQQAVELSRDFVFDKSDLLGTNEEEQELYNEMRRDAAKLIIYRLQTI